MKIKIILLFLFCLMTSGCWNYNELNDLAIITGMGIDKSDEGFKVSLMISNSQSTQGSSREGEAQTTVFTGVGNTITEALNNIDTKSPRTLYLGHLAVAVIDSKIAQNDINPILEALMRNPESANKYYIILARDDKAEDVLKSLSSLESFPSQNISRNIQMSSSNEGISTEMILSNFVIDVLKPGINGVIPSISIQGEEKDIDNQDDLKNTEPKAMLKIRSIGLFKDFKLVTFTTENESKGINIINNNVERFYITNKFEDKYVVVLIEAISCKRDINIKEKKVTLEINASGAILETNTAFDLEDNKTIEKINQETKKNLKELVLKGIEVAKKYETDVFGFGNMIYRKNPVYFKKIQSDWDSKYFTNLDIDLKVNVNLNSKGSLENTIKEKKNEY